MCILLTLLAMCDQGRFHCILFLFFAEHRVTSWFPSGVNTKSQNGLDGSFWNHRWVGRAVLKSWLRPWIISWNTFWSLQGAENYFRLLAADETCSLILTRFFAMHCGNMYSNISVLCSKLQCDTSYHEPCSLAWVPKNAELIINRSILIATGAGWYEIKLRFLGFADRKSVRLYQNTHSRFAHI